jgi:DNA-binding MarR family transcriptional regulator
VSGLIDRAVKRGLVRRDASEDDGRAVRVSLTPDGRRLASVGAQEIGELLEPMTGQLSRAERNRLSLLLGKLLG